MIEVFNENYYIDLDEIENFIDMGETTTTSGETESKINLIKFEMIKLMLEVILSESEIMDEKLGLKSNKLSIPFKIAFNTLLNKKIINYY